ncbi:hypothetical protein MNB_SV-6-725 [hydrothermal vent metagenome]|uniref:Uncharacterized protein n=1 Tax=hydrothermal vent metagenome TaxID=652676 RepID=A0A1W1BMP3_9ZZZZ
MAVEVQTKQHFYCNILKKIAQKRHYILWLTTPKWRLHCR